MLSLWVLIKHLMPFPTALSCMGLGQMCCLLGEALARLKESQKLGSSPAGGWSPAAFPRAHFLGTVLLHVSINDPDERIECTLTEFSEDMKLARSVDLLESWKDLQMVLERILRWAESKCTTFSLGPNHPMQQRRVRKSGWKVTWEERTWGCWMRARSVPRWAGRSTTSLFRSEIVCPAGWGKCLSPSPCTWHS